MIARQATSPRSVHISALRWAPLLFGLGLVGWASGFAWGQQPAPKYPEHQQLDYVLNDKGERQTISTKADWERRRAHILANMQVVMGPLPADTKKVSPDLQVLEEVKLDKCVRRKISYRTEANDRVRAYLFLPQPGATQKGPAVLCLHQTVKIGKEEPAGLGGNPNLHYALHLAERGYVTLAPDYPSFGEY
ncbi:MAG: hypothetical protein ACK5TO_22415, partial [Planctomycetaceae bacterium]